MSKTKQRCQQSRQHQAHGVCGCRAARSGHRATHRPRPLSPGNVCPARTDTTRWSCPGCPSVRCWTCGAVCPAAGTAAVAAPRGAGTARAAPADTSPHRVNLGLLAKPRLCSHSVRMGGTETNKFYRFVWSAGAAESAPRTSLVRQGGGFTTEAFSGSLSGSRQGGVKKETRRS